MKLNLDENFGHSGVALLVSAGHDVATVAEQAMCGASDPELAKRCMAESRCMVTFDLDFANPIVFNPASSAGIAVLRLPHPIAVSHITAALETLVRGLAQDDIAGQLWIVEIGRIRKYQPDN